MSSRREKMMKAIDARREELMHRAEAGREELMQRAEAGREALGERAEMSRAEMARRATEIREQFAEHVTTEAVVGFAGWTLISTGIAWGVSDWIRGRRSMKSLLMPIALVAFGTAVLGGGSVWHRRANHISEAEMRVREDLAGLDPFARLRVLKDVGEETLPIIRRISWRNN